VAVVEQRGMWYVSDSPAVMQFPFKVVEVNFYNLGYYTIMIDSNFKSKQERERIVVESKAVIKDRKLKYPTDILIVRTKERISRLYYLLKGEEVDDGGQV